MDYVFWFFRACAVCQIALVISCTAFTIKAAIHESLALAALTISTLLLHNRSAPSFTTSVTCFSGWPVSGFASQVQVAVLQRLSGQSLSSMHSGLHTAAQLPASHAQLSVQLITCPDSHLYEPIWHSDPHSKLQPPSCHLQAEEQVNECLSLHSKRSGGSHSSLPFVTPSPQNCGGGYSFHVFPKSSV